MRNELRIVGGRWRGRKLRFPDAPGLRPTPDRVRETLFNWLEQDLTGLRCLDLFAGSGALGFEAASRGAVCVVQVERNSAVCEALKRNCALLDAHQVEVIRSEALRFLNGPVEPFDIVFLDPPFHHTLVEPCCHLLDAKGWVIPEGRIYIEAEKRLSLEGLPETWQSLKAKQAGEVGYHLYRRSSQPRTNPPSSTP